MRLLPGTEPASLNRGSITIALMSLFGKAANRFQGRPFPTDQHGRSVPFITMRSEFPDGQLVMITRLVLVGQRATVLQLPAGTAEPTANGQTML